jgi:hypothetical protein
MSAANATAEPILEKGNLQMTVGKVMIENNYVDNDDWYGMASQALLK